ncbi:MAG: cellulose binding domain-containing protein [Marinobacter sp.]
MKTKSRLALLLCGSALTGTAAADSLCDVDYKIQHSWQTGAVHRVQLTYNGPEVRGWELGWEFPGQEEIDSIFNVSHSQDGADVTVENLDWNARLSQGLEIKFGFNVRNPSGEVPSEFYLNGEPCSGAPGDDEPMEPEEPGTPDEPEEPEEPPVDDGDDNDQPPGNPGGGDDAGDTGGNDPDAGDDEPGQDPEEPTAWSLDTADSYLGFVTTKNTHVVESHRFGELSGSVSQDGTASLNIDLDSVDTGIDIRNQRMRQMLFNTARTPNAMVAIELGDTLTQVLGLTEGEVMTLETPATIEIGGESRELDSRLRVQRLGDQRFLVSSAQPLIITADQFGLDGGVEALREVAGLTSISIAVPVDFALFFEADELPTP